MFVDVLNRRKRSIKVAESLSNGNSYNKTEEETLNLCVRYNIRKEKVQDCNKTRKLAILVLQTVKFISNA